MRHPAAPHTQLHVAPHAARICPAGASHAAPNTLPGRAVQACSQPCPCLCSGRPGRLAADAGGGVSSSRPPSSPAYPHAFTWQEPRQITAVGCAAGHPRAVLAALVEALESFPNDLSRGGPGRPHGAPVQAVLRLTVTASNDVLQPQSSRHSCGVMLSAFLLFCYQAGSTICELPHMRETPRSRLHTRRQAWHKSAKAPAVRVETLHGAAAWHPQLKAWKP